MLTFTIEFKDKSNDRTNINLHISTGDYESNILSQGSGFIQICDIFSTIEYIDSHLFIILLDEPDAHLHSSVQKRLMKKLGEIKNSQIFIITHNHQLLDYVKEKEIMHFTQKALSSKNIYMLPDGAKMLVIDDVVKDVSDLIKLKESSHILFVEGYTDYRFLSELIKIFLETNKLAKSVFCYKIFGLKDFDKTSVIKELRKISDLRVDSVTVRLIRDNDFSINSSLENSKQTMGSDWKRVKQIEDFSISHQSGYCLEAILIGNKECFVNSVTRLFSDLDLMTISNQYDEVIERFKSDIQNQTFDKADLATKFDMQRKQRADNNLFLMNHELDDFLIEKSDFRYYVSKKEAQRIVNEIFVKLNRRGVNIFEGELLKMLVTNLKFDYQYLDIENDFPFIYEFFQC